MACQQILIKMAHDNIKGINDQLKYTSQLKKFFQSQNQSDNLPPNLKLSLEVMVVEKLFYYQVLNNNKKDSEKFHEKIKELDMKMLDASSSSEELCSICIKEDGSEKHHQEGAVIKISERIKERFDTREFILKNYLF